MADNEFEKRGSETSSKRAGKGITRRDYLGGVLVGTGAALLGGLTPRELLAQTMKGEAAPRAYPAVDPEKAALFDGPSGIGDYRGNNGNTWDVLSRAHRIRDGVFEQTDVDAASVEDGEYDVVIVGGGGAGVGAAYRLKKERGDNLRVLILENHNIFGGEAKLNEFEVDGYKIYGPQGSNMTYVPSESGQTVLNFDLLYDEYKDIKMPLEYSWTPLAGTKKNLEFDVSNFMFMVQATISDSIAYYNQSGKNRENPKPVRNPWMKGLEGLDLDPEVQRDLMKWHWELVLDRPKEGLEEWLDQMTYEELLVDVHGLRPEVARFCDPLLASALGLGSDTCSALMATLHLGLPGAALASETDLDAMKDPSRKALTDWLVRNRIACFPGGNSYVYRYFLKNVMPDAIEGGYEPGDVQCNPVRFDRLDVDGAPFRVRLGATAIDVRNRQGDGNLDGVRIVYEKDGKLHAVHAKSAIVCCGSWVSRHIVKGAPDRLQKALSSFVHAPVVVANVALRNWKFMEKMGVTTALYLNGDFGFSCNIRQPLNIEGYEAPFDPEKPIVLTFYAPLMENGLPAKAQGAALRWELFNAPFAEIESRILSQMNALFRRGGFKAERDIAGITINRWGHAYVVPQPGFMYPAGGGKSNSDIVREGFGRIFFAHSELYGVQAFIGAVGEGQRAARQALSFV
ncbi:NAD(P)-binding protein [Hyphococcus luteus]|uniref:FAD-dependent oxidoreductase n=1 Tax=Hyphococcus luteus TaxID=2058213 RepID=A0A2S7K206_9PROT|nr:NAD(P)-binding protein [Marinicaulis flavus]PQA86544.1 hypothetical protein CW354_19680 [Marinicaulis flavus]